MLSHKHQAIMIGVRQGKRPVATAERVHALEWVRYLQNSFKTGRKS